MCTGSIVSLLYGAGPRLLECLQLRLKDVDFDSNQVIVRRGKGRKDRRTVLPESVKAPLASHLAEVKRQHGQFVFPAGRVCRDARWGPPSRYHLAMPTSARR